MLIRPTKHELENFGDPDLIIYNAGAFPANSIDGLLGPIFLKTGRLLRHANHFGDASFLHASQ
jgi:hypothetical protein